IPKKSDAEKVLNECKGGTGVISSVERKTVRVLPFPPFNIGDLQKEAFGVLGLSPSRTLQAAERLYLSALISGRAGGAPASGGGFVPDGAGLLPDVPNWQLGLVLSWPIYDGVIGARHDAAVARKDVLAVEVDLHRVQQVAAIRRAYYSARIAEETMPALARALEASKENYVQADTRFRGGLATSIEVADAEALLSDAEVQLALGRFELSRTRAVFARTIAEGL
ncbi:MAG: TolC family protein, partial [Polyangiales bacterium]